MSQPNHPATSLSQLQRLSQRSEQLPLQSDAELLELYLAAGDRAAFEALVVRYAPLVASVCTLTVADRSCAEDAFQATFLILLVQAKKIRKRDSLAAWLHGVAYRCACRLRKQYREQPRTPYAEADMSSMKTDTDPLTALARKMNLEALDRELENLPDQLRAPLVEHYLLGFTAPQIAERMELSVAAVEGRLRRGRHALRSRLAQRGISLAVLVAGSELFQEHLVACEGAAWTSQFVELYFPTGYEGSPPGTQLSVSNSQVSSLVRGETTMLTPYGLKAIVAAGILLAGGTLAALSVDAKDPTRGSGVGSENALQLPALPVERSIMAQIGPASDSSASNDEGAPGGEMSLSGEVGRMEMFGGAGGGMSMVAGGRATDWVRPEAEGDEEPAWLSGGRTALESIERNREVLSTKLDFDFKAWPLAEVAKWLTEETGTKFELNFAELELAGMASADTQVTADGSDTSVREIIRRTISALDMTYVVTESTIELTTIDAARETPNVRFYDLSYVLPNSANANALIAAIRQAVTPLDWDEGSISLVGSIMIVRAQDSTHQQIEMLLLNIAKMNPRNAEQASWASPVGGAVGGGMGGGGGFGGGFGGGGGMGGGGMGGGGMF